VRLACADYTWPAVDHRTALDLVAGLGFAGVDIGFFAGRSHVRPEHLATSSAEGLAGQLRERAEARGLAVPDVFVQLADDFVRYAPSHPDAGVRAEAVRLLQPCLDFAAALGAGGVTVLPGVAHPDEAWQASTDRAAETLRAMVRAAADRGLRLSVEPHVESLIDTPARTADLVAATPDLTLTIDYAHFVSNGATEDEIEHLLPHVRHVQARGGAPGLLQASATQNTIDWARLVGQLSATGYDGWLTTEYVWSEWRGCNQVDNVSETVWLREILHAALGQHGSTPPASSAGQPTELAGSR
jgi:sugar phosphate isomerase/epimerase